MTVVRNTLLGFDLNEIEHNFSSAIFTISLSPRTSALNSSQYQLCSHPLNTFIVEYYSQFTIQVFFTWPPLLPSRQVAFQLTSTPDPPFHAVPDLINTMCVVIDACSVSYYRGTLLLLSQNRGTAPTLNYCRWK